MLGIGRGLRVRVLLVAVMALQTPSHGEAMASGGAPEEAPPPQEELAAITERGKMLYEYDQVVWHVSDAVQMANPKNLEG